MAQFIPIIFLLAIFTVLFFLIRFVISKQKSKRDPIEQKLDRIIALLEMDKKE